MQPGAKLFTDANCFTGRQCRRQWAPPVGDCVNSQQSPVPAMSRRKSILAEGREAADTPSIDDRGSLSAIQAAFRSLSDLAAMPSA